MIIRLGADFDRKGRRRRPDFRFRGGFQQVARAAANRPGS